MEWLCDLLCGDFRLGDAANHERIEGKASSFKYRRPVKVTRKQVILKCKKWILVQLSKMLEIRLIEFLQATPEI